MAHTMLQRIGASAKHAARVAVVDNGGEAHTYAALMRRADYVASHLAHRGVRPGQVVAIVAEPSFAYVAAQLGAWRAGAIAVPLCPEHPVAEQRYIVENSQATAVITQHAHAQASAQLGVPMMDNAELLAAPPASQSSTMHDARQHPTAMLLYTSGSTGRPKGVVTTFDALDAMTQGMVQAWRWAATDHVLHFLPLHHMHGAVNKLLTPLTVGAKVEFTRFNAADVLARLSAERDAPTVFHAVPTVYTKLIEAFDPARHAGASRLKLYVCGSAPLPVPVFERFEALTGHRILERWGMTELGMGLSNPFEPVEARRPGYVGVPLPGVEVRIARDDGLDAAADEPGELQVRGRQVFREYWRRSAEEMRKEFGSAGWFKTGDVAVLDSAAGSYRIVGRASVDIIKSAAYKLSAVDIEREILGHPAVAEVAVVGVVDAVYGEAVAAVVALKPGAELSLEALQAWLRPRMAHYKLPRKAVFVQAIPRNAMHKVNKKELRKLFERR